MLTLLTRKNKIKIALGLILLMSFLLAVSPKIGSIDENYLFISNFFRYPTICFLENTGILLEFSAKISYETIYFEKNSI